MKAYIFPGQGAQFPGMGKDLYETSSVAKDLFEIAEVSECSSLKTERFKNGTKKNINSLNKFNQNR